MPYAPYVRPVEFVDKRLPDGSLNPEFDKAGFGTSPRVRTTTLRTIMDYLGAQDNALNADLVAGLAGKANASHSHAIADVTGLQAALDAKSSVGHTHDQYATRVETVSDVGPAGTAQTVPSPSSTQITITRYTLTASSLTLTFPTAAKGRSFTLELTQDATGGRLVAWPTSVKWPNGAAPVLSTGAGKVDVVAFSCINGASWYGFLAGQDFR